MKKVVVIIPCYNREKYISQTINSVINQTFKNIDIIVIDDGSTDNSRKIIDGYGAYITILEHPGRINRGQSESINLALKYSDSKYVSILDSDDIFFPKKISQQLTFLERNPKIDYVYSNGYAIDESFNYLHKIFLPDHQPTNDPAKVLLECPIGTPSAYLYRRSILQDVGPFDISLRSAQDHDMAIRLSEIGNIAYLDEKLWLKREHKQSLSGMYAERRWKAGFYILEKACSRYNYSLRVKYKRLAVLHYRLGKCFLRDKYFFKALARFFLSGFYDPKRAISELFKITVFK